MDLLAATPGVVNVRIAELEQVNRLDPLEVFTVFDGQIVERGDLVASIKVAPHVVEAAIVDAGARLADFGSRPLVWVAPFIAGPGRGRREGVRPRDRARAVRGQRPGQGGGARLDASSTSSTPTTTPEAVETALARFTHPPDQADLILTAGSASTDPDDPFFVAIEALGGRVVRRGVPAHPGSMLWLARVGATSILGLPTCGAYSKATAADLLLPRLLSGEPASERTVAKLGHGGHPHPVAAVPLPAVRAGARRARRLGSGRVR